MNLNIKSELKEVQDLYTSIGEALAFNKKSISKEIKSFENRNEIELPEALKELFKISNGFDDIIGAYRYDDLWIGVRYNSFEECTKFYNGPVAEYEYLMDSNHPSWTKAPQVNKAYKTDYKFCFAEDNIHLGGYFCIDYRPSVLGKIGQILFITRWGITYVCEDFELFIRSSFLNLKNHFTELKSCSIYASNIKKIIEQDNEVLFKKVFDSEMGIDFNLGGCNLMMYAHKCHSNRIINVILKDFQYPLENYLIDAIGIDDMTLCEKILSNNIDVNKITDKSGNSSLLKEISGFNKEIALVIAEKLIKKGANINYVGYGSHTILDELYLSAFQGYGSDSMIELFEKYGALSPDDFCKKHYYDKKANPSKYK